MAEVERDRERMFEMVRRAWASPAVEAAAGRIGAYAHKNGMTFDEFLYWLWERLRVQGSGSITEYAPSLPGGIHEQATN